MDHHPLRLPGQWFKGNLHAHTRHSDGELTLEEAVRWHQEHAYDFLAVTDHRVVTDTRNFTRPGFLTIPGIEVNTGRTELGMDYHFIALGIEKYSTLPNTMSAQETIDELVVHGAIVPDLCRSLSYGPIPTPLLHLHRSGHVRAAKTVTEKMTALQERYGQRKAVDVSNAWSEEDMHDLIQASLAYAERTIWAGEEEHG